MSKITQARARQDRRQLKELQEKVRRYVVSSYPGYTVECIGLNSEQTRRLQLTVGLGFDVVYRLDASTHQLKAHAVRR